MYLLIRAVPINIREQTPELLYILNHCGAKLLVHELDIDSRVPEPNAVEHLKHRYSIGGATDNARDFSELANQKAPDSIYKGCLLYTSDAADE